MLLLKITGAELLLVLLPGGRFGWGSTLAGLGVASESVGRVGGVRRDTFGGPRVFGIWKDGIFGRMGYLKGYRGGCSCGTAQP